MNGQTVNKSVMKDIITTSIMRADAHYSETNIPHYLCFISRTPSGLPKCRAMNAHNITYNSVLNNIYSTIKTCASSHSIPKIDDALEVYRTKYTSEYHMYQSFSKMYKKIIGFSQPDNSGMSPKYTLRSHHSPEHLCYKYLTVNNNIKESLLYIFNDLIFMKEKA